MHSYDESEHQGGPNSNSSIFHKMQKQIYESRRLNILSSFDFLRLKPSSDLKDAAKYTTALRNINIGSTYSGYLHGFKQRTVHKPNILSSQAKLHDIYDFNTLDIERFNEQYFRYISMIRVMFTPMMIDYDSDRNSKVIDMLAEVRFKLEKRNKDAFDRQSIKQIIKRKINLTSNKNEILRWKKRMAYIMAKEEHKDRRTICDELKITINQYKDAIKNWGGNDDMDIFRENRGVHKKTNSIRSVENLVWIRDYISKQNKPVTAKEVLKAFEDEKLGKKCSKSLIYKMIKEDLNMKFGVPKRFMKDKNSLDNKCYRMLVCQKLLETLTKGVKVISIDETGFSDYIDKTRTWYDPSNRIGIDISNKKQCISYSLLLATSQDTIIGYYLVEGAINSAIYLSFIKYVVKDIPYRTLQNNVVFIMDNARIHKSIIVKDYMAREVNQEWIYMPAYSPEINFIENVFNRIKKTYRKMPTTANK